AGYRPLVQWIGEYMKSAQIEASVENILCATGSQQALDLIAEVFLDPGDCVFVESPTYLGALAVFQKSGARLISVKQDANGIVVEDLEERLRDAAPESRKLIYVISNFQNPSGI